VIAGLADSDNQEMGDWSTLSRTVSATRGFFLSQALMLIGVGGRGLSLQDIMVAVVAARTEGVHTLEAGKH
jgi:hypothetical protein